MKYLPVVAHPHRMHKIDANTVKICLLWSVISAFQKGFGQNQYLFIYLAVLDKYFQVLKFCHITAKKILFWSAPKHKSIKLVQRTRNIAYKSNLFYSTFMVNVSKE